MASLKQNTAGTLRLPFYLNGVRIASPTLAAGDVVIYTAGVSTGNADSLASAAYGGAIGLSATQTNGADVLGLVADQTSPPEWDSFFFYYLLDVRNLDDLTFPTVSGRSLDVSAGGEAGVDWANVGSPTTSVGLTNTTVGIVTLVTTATTVTNQLTAAAIATGVWQDATAGDFTAASSIGKSLYTGGVVPGGTNGLFIAGTNAATVVTTSFTTTFTGSLTGSVASVSGAVGSVTGLTASNLDATISSRMATYTQPSGFLAATFPSGTIANTTNITAGVITTVTNLTNAPTVGDFTAAMKASVNVEALDVLVTDTFAEPSAPPAATASLKDKIGWVAAVSRNKLTQTATTQLVRNDGDSGTIGTSTVSDNGTTATRGKFS